MDSVTPAYGLYDQVLTHELQAALDRLHTTVRQQTSPLGRQEQPEVYLQQHLNALIERVLVQVPKEKQIQTVNRLVDAIATLAPSAVSPSDYITPRVLEALLRQTEFRQERLPFRPDIPLSQSALLTNAQDEYLIGSELAREIYWADQIDCLCAFIKWSGLRQLMTPLGVFMRRGGKLRVLTTTYMQVSDQRAIDKLIDLGAQVKVSYDTDTTRLHAKAWLFHRDTDFTTAYIGSSNLSASALMHGLEWNVRVSKVDARPIVDKFTGTFNTYWEDGRFECYDGCEAHRRRLAKALDTKSSSRSKSLLELHPYGFQEEILQKLEVERFVNDRTSNLVVAATGTGKTVIAALDYKGLRERDEHEGKLSLLFVAHRREILNQSRYTFRAALRDEDFGEFFVGGLRPERGKHVFASVQSLAKIDLTNVDPTKFDMVIIDEFHHAAATTYERLLKHFNPKYLLGLTATPERADGKSVLEWFEGHMAAELRLWDAISLQRLVPFQYFGVADGTDLSRVTWHRGQYDGSELTSLYTGNDLRVTIILRALESRVLDVARMRAIGFCVSVRHAEFMAKRFSKRGIPSKTVTGKTPKQERDRAITELQTGRVNVLFTVDVLTEGVDIPEVDTILLLRPTNSATVFLQQIGRGLRTHPGKDGLIILDFIGQCRREFRFDFKFAALLGGAGRGAVTRAIKNRFPPLPSGCLIELDETSREIILGNLKRWINTSFSQRLAILLRLGPQAMLRQFLEVAGMSVHEFYQKGCLTWLRRVAGYIDSDIGQDEKLLGRKLKALLHVDEPERLLFYRDAVQGGLQRPVTNEYKRRQLIMLLCSLFDRSVARDPEGSYDRLLDNAAICQEISEIIVYLTDEIAHLPRAWNAPKDVPLKVHCRYSMHEIMAAFKIVSQKTGNLVQLRSGVYFDKSTKCNLLLATIDKSEKDYTPYTMYREYAISPKLFYWQSQHRTRAESWPGRRHTNHKALGITPLLFVRHKKRNQHGMTEPYLFLGPVEYVTHDGEQPMSITWKLQTLMPADFVRLARLAV